MILVANVDCTVTGKWILVNQIALTNTFFFCVPRKDSNYAPPNKVAKNAPKSPQALAYHYHQLEEATLSVLFARDRVQNWWLYQIVLGINCFFRQTYHTSCRSKMLSRSFVWQLFSLSCSRTDFSNSNNIRFQPVRFDGIINRNTRHCTKRRIDFDNINSLSHADIFKLDQPRPQQFWWPVWNNSHRNLKRYSHLKCTHISVVFSYEVKVWNAKILCTLFNLGRVSVRCAVQSARKCLSENFVPSYLGFYITREEVISSHITKLAQSLFEQSMSPEIRCRWNLSLYANKFPVNIPIKVL